MIRDLGIIEPGTTLYLPFHTFDSNDPTASVTLTGLATTDIEIYKDGSVTQRASDNGYALLDTDGIDFDGITGLHGISVDLADNSTAGFYAAGSQYKVAVSSVTIDGATINFWLATFRIGYRAAHLNTTIASLSSQTSFTLTSGPAEDDALNGQWAIIHDVASGVQKAQVLILDYTGSTKTVTLAAGATFTAAATDNFSVMGMAPLQPTTTGRSLDVSSGGEAGVDWANVGSQSTSVNLSGTTVNLVNTLTTYTGNTPQTGDSYAIVNSGTHGNSAIKTQTAAIETDTQDIQSRIPAALVSGRMDSNMQAAATGVITAAIIADGAIDAATFAADVDAEILSYIVDDATRIDASALNTASGTSIPSLLAAIVVAEGTADSGTTTTMVDAARTEGDADYWKGRMIVFTSGTIAGQCAIITDFATGTDTITFAPATTQAVGTNTYKILSHVSAWDDTLAEHLASGTTGNALNAAGSAGDPWSTALPGAYGAGSAGYIVGTNLDATVSTRGTAAELAKVPKSDSNVTWNATALASIQSEANDALVANNLDHLVLSAVDTNFATTVHLDSVIGQLADAGTTATFDRTTDSLEAVRDRGDAAWVTATGFATSAALATAQADLDILTGSDGVTLATAQANYAPLKPTTAGRTLDVTATGAAGIDWGNVENATTAVNLSATNIDTDQVVASVSGAVGSVTGAVGSVTGNVGGNVTGSVGSLATQAKADVNAEVLDVLNVDTFAQPGQESPAATTTLQKMIAYLYKALRNKVTQSSTEFKLYADDGTTVDQKATVSDDGTTTTRGEVSTGP